ncbi:MAG TPA: 30S ribosomal protein S12 methylthiotransferase RimO [Chloroflexi bacterium]|nr:30S ribosomal protein S12 methylthiotransferase RimO [Chloroflexota bacterium]
MTEQPRFYLISLGCAKNLVDSEGIALLLTQAGYRQAEAPEAADVLLVNTCGFIQPARDESQEVLKDLIAHRHAGQKIVAAGCYSQYRPDELAAAIPGIDGLIGTRRWIDVVTLLEEMEHAPGNKKGPICHPSDVPLAREDTIGYPRLAVQGASAYLKLADGCRRTCAFCAIPLIKGSIVSRPLEEILADAQLAVESGVRELILIAQDTTDYGYDLGPAYNLARVLEELVRAVPQATWLRVMYAYPGRRQITDELIETMARHPQILPYLDLPLQHAHPNVLRRMRRPSNVEEMQRTIAHLQAAMPQIAIRTTFIVGFPGETEQEFQALLNFVEDTAFDRVGVFTYSHEEGTPAAVLPDDVAPEVKEERRRRLMVLQQPISLAKNQALLGQTLDVLIEGVGEDISVGRSYRDAPEVDGMVLVQAESPVGEIVPVRISDALEYDLIGDPVET